jgi:hypothetical protein
LAKTVQRDRPIILMEMSQPTRQVMADHQLSLDALLYSDVELFEVCPVGKYGKFKLKCRTFSTLNPEHHDLLVVPTEAVKNLFLTFRQSKKLVE